MKEKILKFVIYISGIICLIAFISLRVLPLFNALTVETMQPEYFEFTIYGEQYYKNYIKHFREELPTPIDKYRLSQRNSTLEDADIIAFGDSFFDFSRQKTLPEKLHDSLGLNVHAVWGYYPLDYLHDNNYKGKERKTFIFEIIERDIHDRMITPHPYNATWNDPRNVSKSRLIYEKIRDNIFQDNTEELYTVLLRDSYLTSAIYSSIATIKFDAFKYMPAVTSAYSLTAFDFPVLFWGTTVDGSNSSFYFDHTDSLISLYSTNIADLADKLDKIYNIDLVFCPIPNKYTIWHKSIDPEAEYDQFLPRLYAELEKSNIQYINLHNDFVNADTALYYGTDSHWNENGVDLAVLRILDHLRKE